MVRVPAQNLVPRMDGGYLRRLHSCFYVMTPLNVNFNFTSAFCDLFYLSNALALNIDLSIVIIDMFASPI